MLMLYTDWISHLIVKRLDSDRPDSFCATPQRHELHVTKLPGAERLDKVEQRPAQLTTYSFYGKLQTWGAEGNVTSQEF